MKLADIRKLCDAATPGPWGGICGDCFDGYALIGPQNQYGKYDIICRAESGDDASFITTARTLLPLLLDVAAAAETLWDYNLDAEDALNTLENKLKKLCEYQP